MKNLLQRYEQAQIEKLTQDKEIPDFQPGDTVRVNIRIVEGDKERIQAFEGVCIARKNRGINSSFTVRKISNGEGVERVFPLYSTRVESIKLTRKGEVRRAKLYYMRDLSGKAARIKERLEVVEQTVSEIPAVEAAPAQDSKPAGTAEKKARKVK